MTSENSYSELDSSIDRIEMLTPRYVQGLADPALFTDSNRWAKKNLYLGLPRALSEEEVITLGGYIADESIEAFAAAESPIVAGSRALRAIGSLACLNGDKTTVQNMSTVLRKHYGIRGKRAAVSLWLEQNLSH